MSITAPMAHERMHTTERQETRHITPLPKKKKTKKIKKEEANLRISNVWHNIYGHVQNRKTAVADSSAVRTSLHI